MGAARRDAALVAMRISDRRRVTALYGAAQCAYIGRCAIVMMNGVTERSTAAKSFFSHSNCGSVSHSCQK